MSRALTYSVVALCLLGTVPWFFGGAQEVVVWGLPAWAFYSVAASIGYAGVIAFLLHRYWTLSADEDDYAG